MSYYGHLTESTIIPKKSKEIQVGSYGLNQLSSILKQGKSKLNPTPTPMPKYISKTTNPSLTPKPSTHRQPQPIISETKLIENKLKMKTKIYEDLQKHGGVTKDGLVDFVQKSMQGNNQYQTMRKEFYDQKMREIREKRENNNKYVELSSSQDRERIAWEKRMLEELSGMKKDESGDRVMQSYDRILSKSEREALQQVLEQEEEEKMKKAGWKRKREGEYQMRMEKLRRLGVIEE